MILNIYKKKIKHTYRLTLFPLERSEKGLTGANQISFLSFPTHSSFMFSVPILPFPLLKYEALDWVG